MIICVNIDFLFAYIKFNHLINWIFIRLSKLSDYYLQDYLKILNYLPNSKQQLVIFVLSFFRCLEVSYIGYGPIHDILETWAINGRSSIVRALFWFPFSELTIMSYMNEASQRPQLVSLSISEWIFCKEDFVGLKPSSSKLDVVLKCIAWPHWCSTKDKDQMGVDFSLIIICSFFFL